MQTLASNFLEPDIDFTLVVRRFRALVRLLRSRLHSRLTLNKPEAIEMVTHFSLQSAHLCVQCDNITNNPNQCPACTCANLISLATILDR